MGQLDPVDLSARQGQVGTCLFSPLAAVETLREFLVTANLFSFAIGTPKLRVGVPSSGRQLCHGESGSDSR